jgi:hypothetical protein
MIRTVRCWLRSGESKIISRIRSEKLTGHLLRSSRAVCVKSAGSKSDSLVESKTNEKENTYEYHPRELSFVPSSRRVVIPPEVEREANRLRGCLSEVTRMESQLALNEVITALGGGEIAVDFGQALVKLRCSRF